MRIGMIFSESFLAGFALAATIAKDAGAELARPGLCEASAAVLTGAARELRDLPKATRRERVSSWIRSRALTSSALVWPRVPSGPLRAYALLAQRMTPSAPPAWLRDMRDLTLPRAGYTPEPQLVAWLQRSLELERDAQGGQWDA